MVTEHFEFAGWTDNLRLANDQVEVVILREAGPRIISLRPLNGFNVFKVVAVIPQPPLGTHPNDFLPNRSLTLWPFTDLSDDRIRFGQRFIRFRQADRGPIKFGLRHTEKWAGYVLGDHLFLKTIPLIKGKQYPDLGSNFELFTNEEFLELESLGPYEEISPGQTAKHTEIWAVFSGIRLPHLYDEEGFAEAIDPYLKQLL
jgi:hypothetical protein